MPYKIRYKKRYGWVYPRREGGLVIGGRHYSRRSPEQDTGRRAGHRLSAHQAKYYPQTGDYIPTGHLGAHTIHAGYRDVSPLERRMSRPSHRRVHHRKRRR